MSSIFIFSSYSHKFLSSWKNFNICVIYSSMSPTWCVTCLCGRVLRSQYECMKGAFMYMCYRNLIWLYYLGVAVELDCVAANTETVLLCFLPLKSFPRFQFSYYLLPPVVRQRLSTLKYIDCNDSWSFYERIFFYVVQCLYQHDASLLF